MIYQDLNRVSSPAPSTKQTTVTTHTISTKKSARRTCEDNPTKPCHHWIKFGYCKTWEKMKIYCCKSCKGMFLLRNFDTEMRDTDF